METLCRGYPHCYPQSASPLSGASFARGGVHFPSPCASELTYLSSSMFQYSQFAHSFHSGRSFRMWSLKLYFGSSTFGVTGLLSRGIPACAGVCPALCLLQRTQERTKLTHEEIPP